MNIEVILTRGYLATIDEADFDLVSPFKWYANLDGRTIYARATVIDRGQYRRFSMHRLIMEAAPGQQVDHIDGNGLNNVRSNLRFASNHQNAGNQRAQRTNTSGFKGVTFAKREGRFQASIEVNGRSIWCGYHATAESAARAYDAAALRHFGEFARLNFPEHAPTDEEE